MQRCLIVDDDRDGREGYAEYLRAYGFEVDESVDGESAWKLMRSRKPDILLLDLQLPGLSGWELIEEVRASARLRALPIVAISACAFPDDRQRAEAAGCDVFLTKPALPNEVLAEVKRLLSSRRKTRKAAGTPDA